ncbi:TPA: type VI secretion system contractile sheath large subunit [Legionella pneumophila]|nr:type VI secretion system contractile sheath large subunit [Legionella pneumophila]HAT2137538.1 type VI secretion system contractile sheath large subunit [Legionella pneumophila]HAT2143650.1 type VI secretion system contractile sheath large subunit [Legionella pneumophila]HAT2146801.1 type VI secretion system contractile sheath large subunit [Legionella pneumophila]HAT2161918.1 type VI secretion system contractile sheath large subunit [Legionella pneumophila]
MDDSKQNPSKEESKAIMLDLLANMEVSMDEEQYQITKSGIKAFIDKIIAENRIDEPITSSLIDDVIAEIDIKLSEQVDEILHHPEFQKLESAWRSLKFLVDQTDFRENCQVNFINISKEELLEDFLDSPEIVKSGLYKQVYTAEYGQFGGKPYASIIGNYTFGPSSKDISLLRNIAAVGAMAHAPFIAAAGPEFFNIKSMSALPALNDIAAIFESSLYAEWNALRESEDARYIGLTLPRFMLRLPYSEKNNNVRIFNYIEDVSKGDSVFLWGNSAFALAGRFADSFAKYRWCVNIIGPKGGGAVENLPNYYFDALHEIQAKIPTELLISERREFELAEQGFIPLTMRKGSNNAAFFSANSIQKPKSFIDLTGDKEAEMNYRLGTQLPYMFIVCRLAHYLKILQREKLGLHKERIDMERELNEWIGSYVVDMENPVAEVRAKKPLRYAKVSVEDVAGEPGWYKSILVVRPHFKYMGAYITLQLTGSMETTA